MVHVYHGAYTCTRVPLLSQKQLEIQYVHVYVRTRVRTMVRTCVKAIHFFLQVCQFNTKGYPECDYQYGIPLTGIDMVYTVLREAMQALVRVQAHMLARITWRGLWWRSGLQTSLSSWSRSLLWCLLCWQRPLVSPLHLSACVSSRFWDHVNVYSTCRHRCRAGTIPVVYRDV